MARIGCIFDLNLTTSVYQASFRTDLTISKYEDFNHYAFLNCIYIIYIFLTEVIIIFNCDVVAATQHNICTFVVL
jgi:hypothetical protein